MGNQLKPDLEVTVGRILTFTESERRRIYSHLIVAEKACVAGSGEMVRHITSINKIITAALARSHAN